MPSRQDQLHSYQFMVQRVVSALVLRETDPPQSPFRRAAGAAFASVLVAVVVAAGFGVYAIFTGGGTQKWQSQGAVVVEKGSSAAFLFRDGKLHPALNLTSAILASEQAKPVINTVPAKSLHKVSWGETIGIANLPNSLAAKKDLTAGPWAVCAFQTKEKPVAAVVAGGPELSQGQVIPAEDAHVVVARGQTPGQATKIFVLWRGRIFEVTQAIADRLAGGVQITEVAPAFLNGLPQGEAIKPITVPNSGTKSKLNDLWTVGEVLTVFGITAEDRYVLVREDGLFYVTQLQAQLAAINGQRRSFGEVTDNNRRQIRNELLPKDNDPRQPPSNLPAFKPFNGTGLCSVMLDDKGNTELRANVPINLERYPETAGRSSTGTPWANYVIMPNGQGAIVASGQTLSYVSRDGVRYAAASREVLTKLGYENVNPVSLQSSLVALLPEGPGLDPAKASVPITVS